MLLYTILTDVMDLIRQKEEVIKLYLFVGTWKYLSCPCTFSLSFRCLWVGFKQTRLLTRLLPKITKTPVTGQRGDLLRRAARNAPALLSLRTDYGRV